MQPREARKCAKKKKKKSAKTTSFFPSDGSPSPHRHRRSAGAAATSDRYCHHPGQTISLVGGRRRPDVRAAGQAGCAGGSVRKASTPPLDLLAPLAAAPHLKWLEMDAPGCGLSIGRLPARNALVSAWFRCADAAAGMRALAGGCPSLSKLALVAADSTVAPPVCLLHLAATLAPAPRLARLALHTPIDAPADVDAAAAARRVRVALPRVRVLARGPVTGAAAAVLRAMEEV